MRGGFRYIKCTSCGHVTRYFTITSDVDGNCARCLKPLQEGKSVKAEEYEDQHGIGRVGEIPRERIGRLQANIKRKESEQTILNGKE